MNFNNVPVSSFIPINTICILFIFSSILSADIISPIEANESILFEILSFTRLSHIIFLTVKSV